MRPAARSLLAACALGLSLPTTGCAWLWGNEGVFARGDDVRLDPPGSDGFRSAGTQGDVWRISRDAAQDVNGWVTEVVEKTAAVAEVLNRWPAREDGEGWRVYGPYEDENERDILWVIKLQGTDDSGAYQVYIAERGVKKVSEMDLMYWGDLTVDGTVRQGGFTIDFDVIDKYAFLKKEDPEATYGGVIEVAFERDVATERKYVDLSYDEFWMDAPDDDRYYSDEAYAFRREDDGSGRFHLAVMSTFEEQDWSGPDPERMQLDLRWDETEAGRARGAIVGVDGGGDLIHGDLYIHECFAPDGSLTWREINDDYAEAHPGYNLGDPSMCRFEEADLEG